MKRFISVALIANALFFTPLSITLQVGAVRAEDATTPDPEAVSGTSTPADTAATASSSGIASEAPTSTPSADSASSASSTEASAGQATSTPDTSEVSTSTPNMSTSTPESSTTTATSTPGDGGNGGNGGEGGGGGDTGDQTGTMSQQGNGGEGGAAGQTTGTTTIRTGNAIANASLLNLVNTNFVNSIGELLFLSNLWAQSSGQFDLRSLGFFTGGLLPFCAVCAGSTSLSVVNGSGASASNTVSLTATSGDNLVATPGTAVIETGNAYAAANALNFLNNNFVDSKYLFLTYNNFGDWNGDIVFPNAETFEDVLASNVALRLTTTLDLANMGTADIENDLNLNALSGSNAFNALGGSSTVTTGNSGTSANILNLINSSLVGGASLNVLFNVQGAWSGKIYGLPPGIEMTRTANGFVLSFESFDRMLEDASASTTVSNEATAALKNDFDLSAISGGNGAIANDGSIRTGDSFASANIINVANTNVVGRNMFWAIVNIFGDWSGDVAFGKPDLWVGGHADMEGSQLTPGRAVTYNYTVINNGDTDANDSWITVDLGSGHLSSEGGSKVSKNLGTLKPKESKTVSFTATLAGDLPANTNELVTSVAEVGSEMKDNNAADNSEKLSFSIASAPVGMQLGGHRRSSSGGSGGLALAASTSAPATASPFLSVSKTASAPRVTSSTTVDYSVVIKNTASKPAYGAKLYDRMTGPNGEIVDNKIWDIGTVKPNEEIRISYTIFFKNGTPTGDYPNTAYVVGSASASAPSVVISNIASATVRVDGSLRSTEKLEVKPMNVQIASTSTTTAASVEETGGASGDGGGIAVAHAAGDSLVAAAWYATPTAKQLSAVTAILIILAIAMIAIRRRYAF